MLCLSPSKRPRHACFGPEPASSLDQLQEGGLTAIGGSEGRKVIMENGVELKTPMLAQEAFINFGECWQYADWAVVFFKEGVIFFKYWCYLGHFELGWECFFGLHLIGHFGNMP